MKKKLLVLISILFTFNTWAQVGINIAEPKVSLHIKENNSNTAEGIIIPTFKATELQQKNSQYSHDHNGVLIYVNESFPENSPSLTATDKMYYVTAPGFYYFNGSQWKSIHGNDWNLRGNHLTNIDFIGSTNNQDIRFKRNNIPYGQFSETNIAIGLRAITNPEGTQNNVNTNNIAIGALALQNNEKGYNSIAIGGNSQTLNKTGNQNVSVGVWALNKNTTGSLNVAIAPSALRNNNGNGNIAIGYSALTDATTSTYNTVIGHSAGQRLEGSNNIIIGAQANVHNKVLAEGIQNISNRMNIGNSIYGKTMSVGLNGTYGINSSAIGIGQSEPRAKLHITPANNQNALVIDGIEEVNTNASNKVLVINADGIVQKQAVSNSSQGVVKKILKTNINYTITPDDYTIVVTPNTNNQSIELALPNPENYLGRILYIVNNTNATNTITFNYAFFETETLSSNTFTLKSLQIQSDGVKWLILSQQ